MDWCGLMRPRLTDAELIRLFNQPGTAAQLAQREGVARRDLNRGWQRLRAKGALPLHRPSELYRTEVDDEPDDHRPSVYASDPDPLLTLLRKHHGCVMDKE
jgi:hypothetical protein